MWSNWGDSAKASLTQALEKTGDALSKAATNAGRSARTNQETHDESTDEEPQATVKGRYGAPEGSESNKQQEILKNFQAGWSTVVEKTKDSIKHAQEAVKETESKLAERLHKARAAYYKRDPQLPLDVEALKDAEVVYITDRLITMSHPAMPSAVNGEITGERKLAAVGHLLHKRHDGRYMVWNLSEVEYDISILDEQVLTFSFPGSPSPPLGLLLKLLISMESWLKADDRNVAVVHCLTGKGRTSTVLAAFLCWMQEAGFADIYQALDYIAKCKQITPEELTIPSQRRYASYFKNMLDGVRPSQPPLMLKRVIMSEAPRYARGPPRDEKEDAKKTSSGKHAEDESIQLMGCAPYLQIFKAGKLLHTAPASLHFQQSSEELPFCQVADGSISFHINKVIQGDILIRCRHLTARKQRISMFRAAFHTGYLPPNVMRLTKSQLDGACNDDRFPDDFFLDVIIEAVDAEEASKMIQEGEQESSESSAAIAETPKNEEAQALAGGASRVSASAYDSMLHRDSRFWDVIAARREQHANETPPADAMCGKTVGRRREFGSKDADAGGRNEKKEGKEESAALETFSIGGEFDFLPTEPTPAEESSAAPAKPPAQPKKDSLMEALMAVDEDEHADEVDTEEIVFEGAAGPIKEEKPTSTSYTKVLPAPPAEASPKDSPKKAAMETMEEAKVEKSNESEVVEAKPLAKQESKPESSDIGDDMDALLNLDDDMDALLADSGAGDGGTDDDLLDIDDQELEDLENFLSPSKK